METQTFRVGEIGTQAFGVEEKATEFLIMVEMMGTKTLTGEEIGVHPNL